MARKGTDKSDPAPRAKRPRTIFVSYSHSDETWKDQLYPHLKQLDLAGHNVVVWDDRKIDAGETWYPEIREAMEQATVAVCLISANYLSSTFCVKQEVPFLLQQREEAGLLFVPVLIDECLWEDFDWLSPIQMLPRGGKCIVLHFKGRESTVFAQVARRIRDFLKSRKKPVLAVPKAIRRWPALAPEFTDLTRLPETGVALFGRREELRKLDEAWASGQTRVMACVASGGVGKSTLANYWLRERMTPDQFRGARRVFGWTFYSQGTHATATSADFFIHQALKFFGDPDPDAGSPWQKGERLAELAEGALLVLDGMEPLQADFGADRGRVTDPALAGLLRAFTWADSGLCLITTREPLTELVQRETVRTLDLDRLSPEAGRAVLRTGGVIGTDEELEALAREFGPHALAITLLASWLHEQPGHRPEAAATLPELPELADSEMRPARRVLAGFEQLLGEGPEIEVLRILGLFERAAKGEELRALRKGDALPGLTERVGSRATRKWSRALERLRELRLVARQSRHQPDVVDTHPIVREHFGAQVRTRFPAAWKEGHNRLYEHLKQAAPELPETLEEMMPLLMAVRHGCEAGLHCRAFYDIYWPRISSGKRRLLGDKHGAISFDFNMLCCFVAERWRRVSGQLEARDRGYILVHVGLELRSQGRLQEAEEAMMAGRSECCRAGYKAGEASACRHLSQLHVLRGELDSALRYAKEAVGLALKTADHHERTDAPSTLGDVYHQRQELAESLKWFQTAEANEREAASGFLHMIPGYRYCELLLTLAHFGVWLVWAGRRVPTPCEFDISCLERSREECAKALRQASKMVHLDQQEQRFLLAIALAHLSLGRASLLANVLKSVDSELRIPGSVVDCLSQSVVLLRRAGQEDQLPRGLLARAALRRVSGDARGAAHDLADARELADRCGMKLFQVDCLIEQAGQLIADCGSQIADWEGRARECVAQAKGLIESTGYHRRDPEIQYLEQLLG